MASIAGEAQGICQRLGSGERGEVSAATIYEDGPYEVKLFTVTSSKLGSPHLSATYDTVDVGSHQPPRPLLVAFPQQAGQYPVLVFQHGYALKNFFYSQLMQHVASYGFIVVAPQMYNFITRPDATPEILAAGAIIDWLTEGLALCIAQKAPLVKPDLQKLVLAGHSRGGKVAFGVATGICRSSLKFSALIGIDPVDGRRDTQTLPPILNYEQHSLNLSFPTLVIGAKLGAEKKFLFPRCAPPNLSYQEFFFDSAAPAFFFVASDYGHMDYLDDDLGFHGAIFSWFCRSGEHRARMRRFTGGVMVAFLQAVLWQEADALSDALLHPSQAPVTLEKVDWYLPPLQEGGQLMSGSIIHGSASLPRSNS